MTQRDETPLAMQRVRAESDSSMHVSSKSVRGEIPRLQSEYGDGISPDISWERVRGARSYALILEDPDSHSFAPYVHWLAYNIPANVTSLPAGLQEQARLQYPRRLMQGRNSRGGTGYFGPQPPVGDSPHHYHFQVFALDQELDVPPGAEREEVIAAMGDHVLAAGELVGTYQQTTAPHSSASYHS